MKPGIRWGKKVCNSKHGESCPREGEHRARQGMQKEEMPVNASNKEGKGKNLA